MRIPLAITPLAIIPLAAIFPLLYSPCSTYLAPSSCDRNRPPPSQVACKLTPFAPPFTHLTHPSQIPRTPTCPAPNNDDLGNIPTLAIRNKEDAGAMTSQFQTRSPEPGDAGAMTVNIRQGRWNQEMVEQ